MMKWRKAPGALVETFEAALPDDGSAEPRQMFGYPAAFVNGNMAAGLHQEDLIVRLPEARRAVLLAKPGARIFEPMPGRAMWEYVVVPPPIVAKASALRAWIREAVAYAGTLPGKPKKRASAKAKVKPTKKAPPKGKVATRQKKTAGVGRR